MSSHSYRTRSQTGSLPDSSSDELKSQMRDSAAQLDNMFNENYSAINDSYQHPIGCWVRPKDAINSNQKKYPILQVVGYNKKSCLDTRKRLFVKHVDVWASLQAFHTNINAESVFSIISNAENAGAGWLLDSEVVLIVSEPKHNLLKTAMEVGKALQQLAVKHFDDQLELSTRAVKQTLFDCARDMYKSLTLDNVGDGVQVSGKTLAWQLAPLLDEYCREQGIAPRTNNIKHNGKTKLSIDTGILSIEKLQNLVPKVYCISQNSDGSKCIAVQVRLTYDPRLQGDSLKLHFNVIGRANNGDIKNLICKEKSKK